jgi:hypothetical protein
MSGQRRCEWMACTEPATETVAGARPDDVARDDQDGHFCAPCAGVARAYRESVETDEAVQS